MLVAVIKGPTLADVSDQMLKAKSYTEAFEWRLDYFDSLDMAELKKLRGSLSLPVIFTLRKESHGGVFSGRESKRLKLIEELATLRPDYIDVEYDVEEGFFKKLRDISPSSQIIVSYHDFKKTPDDLDSLLESMQKGVMAIYKIACMANSTLDMLRMLIFTKKASATHKVAGISMGECGNPSRALGPVVNSAICYSSYEKEENALFQISLEELHQIYHFSSLNSSTKIYALLGDPVDKSPGHIFHNRIFGEKKINGVYVKLRLPPEEVPKFFELIKELPFKGFSVTIPLKELVFPYLHHVDPVAAAIGAVNTINIQDGKLSGYNTDAPGALDAIEARLNVRRKILVLIGAGGSARAVAYEATRRGARVLIVNRNEERALKLAEEFGCEGYSLAEMPRLAKDGYDILFNSTPVGRLGDELPIAADLILPTALVMDAIINPANTPFLTVAKEKGCTCIYGYEMFQNQGLLQQEIWKQ